MLRLRSREKSKGSKKMAESAQQQNSPLSTHDAPKNKDEALEQSPLELARRGGPDQAIRTYIEYGDSALATGRYGDAVGAYLAALKLAAQENIPKYWVELERKHDDARDLYHLQKRVQQGGKLTTLSCGAITRGKISSEQPYLGLIHSCVGTS
jgi:hypothetical protein